MAAAQPLLDALDELKSDDVRRFQFFLNMQMVEGCKPISRQRLEGQPRDGIVAVMLDHYGDESAVEVASAILERIGSNNIMRKLNSDYEKAKR